MNQLIFTNHANERMKSRGISMRYVDFLLDYGASTFPAYKDSEVIYFDDKSKQLLKKNNPSLVSEFGKFMNISLVLQKNTNIVLTVMRKYRKEKHTYKRSSGRNKFRKNP
jgi:hypothetical protein